MNFELTSEFAAFVQAANVDASGWDQALETYLTTISAEPTLYPENTAKQTNLLRALEWSFHTLTQNHTLGAVQEFLYWTGVNCIYKDYGDGYIFPESVTDIFKARAMDDTIDNFEAWCYFSVAPNMTPEEVARFFERVNIRAIRHRLSEDTVGLGSLIVQGCFARNALNPATHLVISGEIVEYIVIQHAICLGPLLRCFTMQPEVDAVPEALDLVMNRIIRSHPQYRTSQQHGIVFLLLQIRSARPDVRARLAAAGQSMLDATLQTSIMPTSLKTHLRACLADVAKPVFPFPTKTCAQCHRNAIVAKLCSACKDVRYCSLRCQRAHWKSHKKDCV